MCVCRGTGGGGGGGGATSASKAHEAQINNMLQT